MRSVVYFFLLFFKQRFSSSKNRFIKHPENETNIIEFNSSEHGSTLALVCIKRNKMGGKHTECTPSTHTAGKSCTAHNI